MMPTRADASSGSLDVAVEDAELGLPIPKGARRRFLKRLVERLNRPFMFRQIAFNRAVVAELARLDDLREQVAQLGPRIDLVQRQAFTREHEALAALRDELVELGMQIQEALTTGERTDAIEAHVQELADAIGAHVQKLADAVSEMGTHSERDRSEARIRQAQVDLFLTEVRRSLPAPPDAQRLSRLPSPLDNMCVALEDAFRGSNEVIKERAREYLDDVLALPRKGPVVDVGCGRGEWLEVLKESGVDAYGIDLNPHFVEGCVTRGLDVRLGDAFQHLAEVPERSLAAVTALHVAEHLPIEALVELIDLSIRALEPGGLLILETPNPDSLVVGASTFYIDPGHVRPLNPRFLAFLVGVRGLADVEVRYKHPADDGVPAPDRERPWAVDLLPVVEAINHRIFGPLDYAVLGRRV
jgi:O-antigen chain-terminating methyltransferase